MKLHFNRRCVAIWLLSAVCIAGGTAHAEESLTVGVAETDITPPNGFPIAGYYHQRLAEGTIDPLKAKAIAFQQGDQQAALVVCDLTAISRDLCETVRQRASQKTGIPATNIAISGTHSHTAPDYGKHLYQNLRQSDNAEAGSEKTPSESERSNATPPYAEKLLDGIVHAVVTAHAQLSPVTISAGSGQQQPVVSFNRRFVMKDGSVQTWRNLADPKVVRPAGPIDPEVSVVAFKSESGEVSAVLSNFALHLDTVGGMRWSGDYPFFIEQRLRDELGQKVVSIFGTGCCGDINHVDPSSQEKNKTEFIGNAIAKTIKATLPTSEPLKDDRLQVRSTVVPLPLQDVTSQELERSSQLLKLIKQGGKVDFLDQVSAYKILMLSHLRGTMSSSEAAKQLSWGLSNAWGGVGETLPVDVQTICIGDELAIVLLPGEVFVELGLAIKQASPYRHTLVIELSNCVETAYIPTRAACAGGSYEVTNSTVKPGAGELLVEAALRLLRDTASAK